MMHTIQSRCILCGLLSGTFLYWIPWTDGVHPRSFETCAAVSCSRSPATASYQILKGSCGTQKRTDIRWEVCVPPPLQSYFDHWWKVLLCNKWPLLICGCCSLTFIKWYWGWHRLDRWTELVAVYVLCFCITHSWSVTVNFRFVSLSQRQRPERRDLTENVFMHFWVASQSV